MDDEPMWAADRVVAPTPGSAITIHDTLNEFTVNGNHLTLLKENQFDGKIKTDPHKHIHEFLGICDMFKYRDTVNEVVRLMIDDEDDEATPQPEPKDPKPLKETQIPKPYKPKIPYPQRLRKEKMKAQYGKFLDMIRAIRINEPLVDVLARMPNYGKFLKELKQVNLGVKTKRMIFHIDSTMKLSYSNDDTCFSIDVIDEILEEDFDALLDEGSKILHSIKGTILEEKLFAEFDEFIAMTIDENFESKSNNEELPFEKITFNTDYKIKTSLEEPLTDLELKPLLNNLDYVFLEESSFLPVIISSQLSEQNKNKLVYVLKRHKQAFASKQ
nr:reverse transcriptase domain-containing protein [Tanacetum cinerariifolium]